jgi:hypothetical protein
MVRAGRRMAIASRVRSWSKGDQEQGMSVAGQSGEFGARIPPEGAERKATAAGARANRGPCETIALGPDASYTFCDSFCTAMSRLFSAPPELSPSDSLLAGGET